MQAEVGRKLRQVKCVEQEVCPYSRVLGSYPLDVTGSRIGQAAGGSGLASSAQEPIQDTLEEQLEAGILGIAGDRLSLADGPSISQLLSGSFSAEIASSSEVLLLQRRSLRDRGTSSLMCCALTPCRGHAFAGGSCDRMWEPRR